MTLYLWIVLALLFLILALVSYLYGKPIQKNLETLADEGPHAVLTTLKGKDIELNDTLKKAFNFVSITNLIGFILASAAAVLSAF